MNIFFMIQGKYCHYLIFTVSPTPSSQNTNVHALILIYSKLLVCLLNSRDIKMKILTN